MRLANRLSTRKKVPVYTLDLYGLSKTMIMINLLRKKRYYHAYNMGAVGSQDEDQMGRLPLHTPCDLFGYDNDSIP